MGILDEVASAAMAKATGGTGDQPSGLASGVMEMLNSQPGGLTGLLESFHSKGLGGVVSSWVSTGQNLPISGEQIQSVLGDERVKQLAAKAGLSPEAASSKLAELLPGMVDKLTPDGKIPEGGNLLEQALGFLGRSA